MGGKKAALEKKAAVESEKEAANDAKKEAADAEDWSVGAKDSKKSNAKQEQEAERLRKQREKQQLEEMDNLENSGVKSSKKPTKKKKDDFDLLNLALAKAPKSKAQKEAEEKKKKMEEDKKARLALEEKRLEEKRLQNENEDAKKAKYAAKGMVDNMDDLLRHDKSANKLDDEDEISMTGLDNLAGLSMSDNDTADNHPEKRMKALYNAYLERELPEMRLSHPGLKLSQYKERIFEEWKKSPENPHNQPRKESTVFGDV
jgi:hypothetical protein